MYTHLENSYDVTNLLNARCTHIWLLLNTEPLINRDAS
jgi:hypothetical protein